METCKAKIKPFIGDLIVSCELDEDGHTNHQGVIKDYAYKGSRTKLDWMESDRRTFYGEWERCDSKNCVLPKNHPGNHA